jgi:hypothetical protein
MPHLSRFPDSPESPLPPGPTEDGIADIPTQKQDARPRSLYARIDDIIRLDTIKIAARRSHETITRIPTVHIPTISRHLARIPTVHIPAISQHLPAAMQRRLSARPHDRLLLIIMLIGVLVPISATLLECLNAYSMYNHAQNGVEHLLQVKTIFMGLGSGSQAHPSGFLDMPKLYRAQHELQVAHSDFQQLQLQLQRDALASSVLPQQTISAYTLSKIGLDVTEIGQQLTQTDLLLASTLRGSLIQDTGKPLVTPATLLLLRSTNEYLLPRLHDMENLSHTLSLDTLPISLTQRQQLTHLLSAVSGARADLQQTHDMLDAVGWILGVNKPRTFLVQTMDSSELRPTGGFTGLFGELHIQGGRIAPLTLKNIGLYEENNPESRTNGQQAPASRSWWPIPNWGLRDSNLSADFPTSAQLALSAYKHEFGRSLDGVILLSPLMISRVLTITGPMSIPAYHETITAQNLEERLHYYQLDNVGIRKEELIEHIEDPTLARKSFTATLTRTLIDHVRHAPPDELIAIARELLQELLTKDVQVYVTNQQIETLLIRHAR